LHVAHTVYIVTTPPDTTHITRYTSASSLRSHKKGTYVCMHTPNRP